MSAFRNHRPFTLSGRWTFRLRNIYLLLRSSIKTTLGRLITGPLLPNWVWALEFGTQFVRDQFQFAYDLPTIKESREFLDALVPHSPALEQVEMRVVQGSVRGIWCSPEKIRRNQVILHLEGGAYWCMPRSSMNNSALIALASGLRTFVLNYRLSPEYAFPAQLEDALKAYDWLREFGIDSEDIIVVGVSAGGNLCLSLLLALRDRKKPMPALAMCWSPWTDLGNSGASMTRNQRYDLFDKGMCDRSASWYLGEEAVDLPAISPLKADLRDLPPIYIQAGSAELFIDMITAFEEKAKGQGAEVNLEVWENMNHLFQAYGDLLPESREALKRIGEVIGDHVG